MNIADELRERTALKYIGDCKCGRCQLVPSELVDRAITEIIELRNALMQIEQIGWREGTKYAEWLLECRGIARAALEREQKSLAKAEKA